VASSRWGSVSGERKIGTHSGGCWTSSQTSVNPKSGAGVEDSTGIRSRTTDSNAAPEFGAGAATQHIAMSGMPEESGGMFPQGGAPAGQQSFAASSAHANAGLLMASNPAQIITTASSRRTRKFSRHRVQGTVLHAYVRPTRPKCQLAYFRTAASDLMGSRSRPSLPAYRARSIHIREAPRRGQRLRLRLQLAMQSFAPTAHALGAEPVK
jgi:hypothetical protein